MNSERIWANFIESPDIQAKINCWLSDDQKLKMPYRIAVSGNHLVFTDKRSLTDVTPQEMGSGVSQVLPVLIAALTCKNYKIFIEQPELHLHPAVQCEIADELIKSAKCNGNEFVVETHSEHLLLRIMKRLRQTAEGSLGENDEVSLTTDDICLLYVDNNGESTFITELELDEDGTLLDPWPNGFFEEGFRERFDLC